MSLRCSTIYAVLVEYGQVWVVLAKCFQGRFSFLTAEEALMGASHGRGPTSQDFIWCPGD